MKPSFHSQKTCDVLDGDSTVRCFETFSLKIYWDNFYLFVCLFKANKFLLMMQKLLVLILRNVLECVSPLFFWKLQSKIYFTATLTSVKPRNEITWEVVKISRYLTSASKNHLFYQIVRCKWSNGLKYEPIWFTLPWFIVMFIFIPTLNIFCQLSF